MRKFNLYFTLLILALFSVACSDSVSEMDAELISPDGTPPPGVNSNVFGANFTQTIGSGQNACTEFYVYAVASGGFTVNYNRIATITIIRDEYTDPLTNITEPASLVEQHTIPAGSSVSPHRRILANVMEEYDQTFTYRVEQFTDAMGNPMSGYTLLDRTYTISGNCYTNPGNGGGGWTGYGCELSGGNAYDCDGLRSF